MKKGKAISYRETHILRDETKEEQPVSFNIRALTGPELAEVNAELMDSEGKPTRAMGLFKAFKLGVTGWNNIEDPREPGKPLRFSSVNFAFLFPEWMYEVGGRIITISYLEEEDIKKS